MSRAKPAAESETGTAGKQVFYLVDEDQSANLHQFRLAMQGLAALACDEMDKGEVLMPRLALAALIDQLEKRLGNILGDYTSRTTWVDRAARRSAAPHGPMPEAGA